MASVLIQKDHDSNEHVIYNINKKISNPELKYTHNEKMALAFIIYV